MKKIEIFSNGDTRKTAFGKKQISVVQKVKRNGLWDKVTEQKFLFYQYPDLEKKHTVSLMSFVKIYNQNITKSVAMLKLAHWFKNVEESGFKSFTTLKRTITRHYSDILNYFEKRSTNASAESFNAKIKNFRLQLRGVRDKSFFLFRLSKLFA
ncbi:transposase [Chryseobacterium arachidis]|uniref:transposase n=1 Tax=Chryseobacterium arachidis TaxID=1416778 RepID=UPI003618E948